MRPRRVMRRRLVARTAVLGGTAYYAAKRGARSGQQEAGYDEGLDPGSIEQIKQLDELRQEGVLTEEEFNAEKKKLLGL